MKRTFDSSLDLKPGVHQDLARLALCTKKFGCFSYMLVSGDSQLIEKDLLSTFGQSLGATSDAVKLNINELTLEAEYQALLEGADINSIYVKYQGSAGNEKSTVYIWEVSDKKDSLGNQRPYEFYIVGPKALTSQSTQTQ